MRYLISLGSSSSPRSHVSTSRDRAKPKLKSVFYIDFLLKSKRLLWSTDLTPLLSEKTSPFFLPHDVSRSACANDFGIPTESRVTLRELLKFEGQIPGIDVEVPPPSKYNASKKSNQSTDHPFFDLPLWS